MAVLNYKEAETEKEREVMMHKKTVFLLICGCADIDRDRQH